jgi:hypothetical protein
MARDRFHYNVKEALEKDGWIITADPLAIPIGITTIEIDLAAEMAIGAEKDGLKIAVEIKSFLSKSPISEFHMAMGQYGDYREALEESEPERILYLAVPIEIYRTFFQARFIKKRIEQEKVKLVVYESENKSIVEWIN